MRLPLGTLLCICEPFLLTYTHGVVAPKLAEDSFIGRLRFWLEGMR